MGILTERRVKSPECPLGYGDARQVPGVGPKTATVAIVGEAPGYHEDREGKPFVGPAGQMLDRGLLRAELRRESCYITNVLCCRPPSNKIDDLDAQEAVLCCGLPNLEKELASLPNLRTIIALGNTALHALVPEAPGITKARGSIYQWTTNLGKPVWVLPTLHPAALLYAKGRGESVGQTFHAQMAIWGADLVKAARISADGWKPPVEAFQLFPTVRHVEEFLDRCSRGALVGCDIETTALSTHRPNAQIICVGLSCDGHTLVVPFLKQYGEPYWTPEQEPIVRLILQEILKRGRIVFQNCLFDVPWLEHTIGPVNLAHDVLLLHHAISPELPHDLGFIVSSYGDTPSWKGEVAGRKGRLVDEPDQVVRTYNARDAAVLLEVLDPLISDAKELGVYDVYESISMGLVRPLMHIKESGLPLSKTRLKAWRNQLEEETACLEATLRSKGALDPEWNPNSDDDLRLFLFGANAPKYRRAAERLAERIQTEKRQDTKVHQQLESLVRIAEETRPLASLDRYVKTRTGKGKIQVDRQSRLRLQIFVQSRIDAIDRLVRRTSAHDSELAGYERLLDWLKDFNEYQEKRKLLSTYTDYRADPDGRIRASYKIHGTATGRLSSSDPNAQNIPKSARRIFVAPKDHVFVSADYSNLELRLAAYISGDEPLIRTFERGENVHDQNTRDLFDIDPDHAQWDRVRRAAKVYIFGRNYGGGLRGIFERVAMDAPDLALTFARFREVDQRYRKAHPQYTQWFDSTAEEVKRTRKLTSLFGRTRYFLGPDYSVEKEGVNFPIQSAAADIINKALIILYRYIKGQPHTKIIAQIHDALLLEVHQDMIDAAVALVRDVMQLTVEINGRKVSFPVDISVGPDWYNMHEYTSAVRAG